MRGYGSADNAVRAYLELRDKLGSAHSSPIGEKVQVPDLDCAACGHSKRKVSVSRTKGTRTLCESCGHRWHFTTVIEGLGHSSARAEPANLDKLHRYCELGRVFSRLPLWQQRVLALCVSFNGHGRRIDAVTAIAAERWPRRRGGWSQRIVRDLLRDARVRVERELERLGLLD